MQANEYDVIIVGTGIAGLYTALSLPTEYSILMVTKEELEESDSYLAQGGIATLLGPDDYESYYNDTMKAGRYENNPQSVAEMIHTSSDIVKDLQRYGVEFDRGKNGDLEYTREGGHSTFRILHHQDITGKEIVSKLLQEVKKRNNIIMWEKTRMLDLIIADEECSGIVISKEDKIAACYAKQVVLATGGLGGLFQNSTNFPHITGDSFSLALRHKICMDNIHYIQIHPTVLYSKKPGRKFLISESVRGEGAILLNEDKERFVDELLPRDIVADAIRKEMEKYGTDYVYLNLTQIPKEKILTHFPHIYERCLEEGYDVTTDCIPVTPAQHYLMGGITTNVNGETSMKSLYAVGETACNGVHGANRLASNSLLESLVFAKNAAKSIEIIQGKTEIKKISVEYEKYQNLKAWDAENKRLLLNEIKRKDEKFYDKWCNI
ncbi:MAG: L-aspartate oxidase [Lachnospiraceae bacterium]